MSRSKVAGASSKAVDGAAAANSATAASLTVVSPKDPAWGRVAVLEKPLPEPARLALVIALSFSLDALGRVLLDRLTNDELGSIEKRAESKPEIAVWAVWKV